MSSSEKKTTYKGSTEAQRRSVAKYKREKIDQIIIQVPRGRKDHYKAAAASVGESLNTFAVKSMDARIDRLSGADPEDAFPEDATED